MKKATFGLLATAALVLTPITAFAQDSQQSIQINRSNAAAVGQGNYINQTTDQMSNQSQLSIDSYGYGEPSSQMSVQDNISEASAVGNYNLVNQEVYQQNDQTNVNTDLYTDYYTPQY